jgi:hypothetical protein
MRHNSRSTFATAAVLPVAGGVLLWGSAYVQITPSMS